jgi:hypothetical protein
VLQELKGSLELLGHKETLGLRVQQELKERKVLLVQLDLKDLRELPALLARKV